MSFSTWFLVSAIAPKLQGLGFNITNDQLYWLAAMPGLAGGLLRLVWTFLPPIVGDAQAGDGIDVAVVDSASRLVLGAAESPDSYAVLMVWRSSLASAVETLGLHAEHELLLPRAKQGTALGLQAGIGNPESLLSSC